MKDNAVYDAFRIECYRLNEPKNLKYYAVTPFSDHDTILFKTALSGGKTPEDAYIKFLTTEEKEPHFLSKKEARFLLAKRNLIHTLDLLSQSAPTYSYKHQDTIRKHEILAINLYAKLLRTIEND
jgi:hypothetical protein